MSLQSETVTTANPLKKVVKITVIICIALAGLWVYGYTKPIQTEEITKEVTL
ncbi:MAG: hypothetical protein VX154_02915 [Pseudomonadota bacterium]|nr:hypothetical protein [Pseudomonadota bacterium]|tara:strand:- start:1737 stop:1892 length:156 start_codon:yes stop_codon:yes gene_type:complete